MHQSQFEIVVLKPTTIFLSFLASQLPENDVPSFKSLQTNNTAYVIQKHNSDDATLDEIERHFSLMFRREIGRWLGEKAHNEIEKSFIDFLCCFKLEFHSHIILMESALKEAHQVLTIKPRQAFLDWMNIIVEEQEELATIMEQVDLSHLVENATMLAKNFSKLTEIKPFIQQYYKPIFETVMSRMSNQPKQWPKIDSFPMFRQYFTVEIHTQLIHLHH